jgi:hypothetical protein
MTLSLRRSCVGRSRIIRLLSGGDQGIAGEELLGGRVIVAGAQVVQPRLGVLVLPGVAQRVGDGFAARGGGAVGVVGVAVHHGARLVGHGADTAQLVGVVVVCYFANVDVN